MENHQPSETASSELRPDVPDLDTTSGQFDLATVVKLSQAISGEIVLNRLIERLMVIAVEHAGAVRGLLLLPQGDELGIAAEATAGHGAVDVQLRHASATGEELPESILRHVIGSQDGIILGDALVANQFSSDDYIHRNRPRSVLCLPLVNQARLIGVLYLENHLSAYVFTPARITVLQLLASQAAISLENAHLYADLDQTQAHLSDAQRRIEESSRRVEKELRAVIDTIPGQVWTTAANGSNDFVNKRWLSYARIPLKDTHGVGWAAAFHPADIAGHLEKWRIATANGTPLENEARLRRFDGEYRWFLFRADPLRDDNGNIIKWYGINTDIQELKQAEALLAGEKRLLEMIAKGDSLHAILDALCRIVEELAAGSLASILLLDQDGKRLRHGAAPSLPASYTKAIDGGPIGPSAGSCGTAAYRGEKVFVSDISTDPLWADYRELALAHGLRACWSTPILSSEGAVLGTFAIYAREPRQITDRETEITDQFTHLASIVVERKCAEDALRTSEAFLAEGQRISRTGSWSWNVASGKVVWSEESYRIFGYAPGSVEPTFRLFAERVHPEDMPLVQDILKKAIRDGNDFHFDYRIILPDGSIKHLQSVGRHIVKESGRTDDYIGTTMDITDRKRSEGELRQSEASLRKAQSELAHVTRVTTMGELAASIAHEVNQPIAGVVINGTTCLRLLSRLKENSENVTQISEAIHRIIRDGTRAGEVLARIRSLFKKAESAKEPLDMNEAIREVIILIRNEMEKNRIALRLELAADLPWVIGDRVQLQQVMLNLILNAIEAMSTIQDRPRDLVIATQITEEEAVQVMVRDSGAGLDPLSMEQVFTAFHTTKPGGLGMGLSISRSIVEHHGGRLWATANAGPGATFQFALSAHPHENPART